MRIIAYRTSVRDGKILLEESTGERVSSNKLADLFTFLLEPYEDTIRICFDLDTTVSLFLKELGYEACVKLQKKHKCHAAPFSVFYIAGKVFSVEHIPSRTRCSIYGIDRYFPELPEPDSVHDVQMLGERLMYELDKMGLHPTKLTSPIAIYEECVLRKLDLPKFNNIPIKAAELAYRCSGRLWIETHILGYFDKVYDYDLRAAFPNALKNLVDIRDCKCVPSNEYQDKAVYGYADCLVTIYDWVMVSPIVFDIEEGLISPTGTRRLPLDKGKMDFIMRHGIGEFKILDGYWLIPFRKLRKPLEQPMNDLLKYKDKTGLQSLVAKGILVGVYGKQGEEWDDQFGTYFNPVWFNESSSQPTIEVAEFLYGHGIGAGDNAGYRTLIHIGVDGAMMTQAVDLSQGDGRWRLTYEGDALSVSSGLIYTRETKPKGLRINDIMGLIREHPRRGYYEKKVERKLTLGDCSQHPQLLNFIGMNTAFSSSINLIHQEHDRVFKKKPRTGESLLNNKFRSSPRTVTG